GGGNRCRSRSAPARHTPGGGGMREGASLSSPLDVGEGLTRIDSRPDRPAWMTDAASVAEPQTRERSVKPVCAICHEARWVKEAVPFGRPHFGVLFPCACMQEEWAHRTASELARLSNLDAVRGKTFATLNPFVPGLREVVPQVRAFARKPD